MLLTNLKAAIPRLRVMEMSKAKGLWSAQQNPCTFFLIGDAHGEVCTHKEIVPELVKIFLEV